MSDECNCGYYNDICLSCRKAELETIMELTALRAWKEKAMPLLLALNSRLVQDMELFPENIPQLFEGQKATLTELLKEATK